MRRYVLAVALSLLVTGRGLIAQEWKTRAGCTDLQGKVEQAALSPGGKVLATVSRDQPRQTPVQVKLHDAGTGKEIWLFSKACG